MSCGTETTIFTLDMGYSNVENSAPSDPTCAIFCNVGYTRVQTSEQTAPIAL